MVKYGLLDRCPPWYSDMTIKPHYENEDICLLWDIPKFLGYDEEDDSKIQRPDGKLIFKQQKLKFILEMSVPWITNRHDKLIEKEEKYADLILAIKVLYPDYDIVQMTLIMDCLGGYSASLPDGLKKIGFSKKERTKMLTNLQKIVLMESRYIINRFKQRTRISK